MARTAFLYTDDFLKYDYGPFHPLKILRLKLTYELIRSCGLLSLPDTRLVEAVMAGDDDLLLFHEKGYIDILRAVNEGLHVPHASDYGLGSGDNPLFKGILDWSRLVTGASLQASSLVADGEVDIALNISGGLHHAMPSMASGFCYVNDAAIAIKALLRNCSRVAYIDIDAHHGDGVQEAFYNTDRVLTISIHETGMALFPGSGFETETGEGRGEGYSVNVPLPPFSDDEVFLYAFNSVVPPLIERYKPEVVVAQLGVDSLCNDPLTHLNLTNNSYAVAVKSIKELSPKLVALGGGGYDISNVARAWTLAWAIFNEIKLPDEIPDEFIRRYSNEGFTGRRLRDGPYCVEGPEKERMIEDVRKRIDYLKGRSIL